ncbi:hypothetical protein [Micromonospora haikouensis]|uniref:hypothetical protein n=1 Tax=Micromonospora haikouensis TaxID=686309 RepID=UPI003D717082
MNLSTIDGQPKVVAFAATGTDFVDGTAKSCASFSAELALSKDNIPAQPWPLPPLWEDAPLGVA